MKILKTVTGLSAVIALSGCLETAGNVPNQKSFAEATQQNILVQTGQGGSVAYLQLLSQQFRDDVPTMINFDFNSTQLDGEARRILALQADWIKSHTTVMFRVYGHTDLVGSNAYNRRLGLRRARAAVNYLVSLGVPRNRLDAYSSLGETEPLINTPDRERLNRRTVTDVFGFAPNVTPSDFDGRRAYIVYGNYVTFGTEIDYKKWIPVPATGE